MHKLIKAVVVTFMAYLLQVCVLPYLKINEITPNLIMATIAVFTVSYGKKYAFGTAAMSGIIIETMSVDVNVLAVVLYPVFGLTCAQFFSDMSDRKREQRRTMNKSQDDKNVYLRIFLNTIVLTALYEGSLLIYISLSGITVTFIHFVRTFQCLIYTGFISLVVMFPIRWILGMYDHSIRKVQPKASNSL